MPDSLGSLCLVLHGHLPYVLHHGTYPHGEAWLYEAAAETYLPLLGLIDEIAQNHARPALTIGLTPVLLEQLAHERFKTGFVAYLKERIERAGRDRREFETGNEPDFAQLAIRWEKWYGEALEHFERIGRDLPREFAARWRSGLISVLTSNATHAYMPLLLNDESIRAQLACGTETSHRHLGGRSQGMWLPECAYRPTWDNWVPPVLYHDARHRIGLESFIAGAGLNHFFVDTHMIGGGQPIGTMDHGEFRAINDALVHWDGRRGWNSPLDPVGVVSAPGPPSVYAFARHPRVSEQVWSSIIGYPGSGEYLEFHRKHGEGGLRYHRVTSHAVPLHEKRLYAPGDIEAKLYEHSQHFCSIVRETLSEYHAQTGRRGVVVAPFDAELFGHWWFEGQQFLRNVILTLAYDKTVELMTSQQILKQGQPDKVMRLPEGSWGEGGHHGVWLNDRTRWIWEVEYRAETRMLGLLRTLPWRTSEPVRGMLQRAGRELLLLQASDWPFVIRSGGAVDYGISRFAGHSTRFDRLTTIAETLAAGVPLGAIEKSEIDEADLHDSIFVDINLEWWS